MFLTTVTNFWPELKHCVLSSINSRLGSPLRNYVIFTRHQKDLPQKPKNYSPKFCFDKTIKIREINLKSKIFFISHVAHQS